MVATDALAVLPHSVVFAFRKERAVTALPVKIPHPDRALSILRSASAPKVPAVENFAAHISESFGHLRHLIKRHEEAIVWGA